MDHADLTVSNVMEKSIGLQRVIAYLDYYNTSLGCRLSELFGNKTIYLELMSGLPA